MRTVLLPLAAVTLLAGGCSDEQASTEAQTINTSNAPAWPSDDPFADVLAHWNEWEDVYTTFHVAPEMCIPPSPVPAHRVSDAPDNSPHGRKLYRLKVSSLVEYADLARADPSVGFASVKVAHAPRPDAPDTPGDFVGLFIMKRIGDANTPDTDQGWLYATTDADLKVTSSGLIASCMECHAEAPHGRLFGPLEDSQAPAPAPK